MHPDFKKAVELLEPFQESVIYEQLLFVHPKGVNLVNNITDKAFKNKLITEIDTILSKTYQFKKEVVKKEGGEKCLEWSDEI